MAPRHKGEPPLTHLRSERYEIFNEAHWDFFTAASGVKAGYLTNVSQTGCLLQTNEPIEHKRWIRVVIKDPEARFWMTLVGRAVRCENKLRALRDEDVALYSYGV